MHSAAAKHASSASHVRRPPFRSVALFAALCTIASPFDGSEIIRGTDHRRACQRGEGHFRRCRIMRACQWCWAVRVKLCAIVSSFFHACGHTIFVLAYPYVTNRCPFPFCTVVILLLYFVWARPILCCRYLPPEFRTWRCRHSCTQSSRRSWRATSSFRARHSRAPSSHTCTARASAPSITARDPARRRRCACYCANPSTSAARCRCPSRAASTWAESSARTLRRPRCANRCCFHSVRFGARRPLVPLRRIASHMHAYFSAIRRTQSAH